MRNGYLSVILCFFLYMAVAQEENCGLDNLFTNEFITDWQQDSTGQNKIRIGYYKKIFAPIQGKERSVALKGKNLKCIQHYFGTPNIVREKEKEVILTYFVSLSWIDSQNPKNFEGIVLQVIISKDQDKVSDYYFMIT